MAEPETPTLLSFLGMVAAGGGAWVARNIWERRKTPRPNAIHIDLVEIKTTLAALASGQNERAIEMAGIKAAMATKEDLFTIAENIGSKTEEGFKDVHAKIDLTVTGIHTRINGLQTQITSHLDTHAQGGYR